jgi:hypothetical protein
MSEQSGGLGHTLVSVIGAVGLGIDRVGKGIVMF